MTTEQMAEQYASKEMNSFLTFAPLTSNEIYDIIKQAYVAGANGRWVKINSEDDLPKQNGEYLTKGAGKYELTFFVVNQSCVRWLNNYTHWQPITPPQD